MEYFLRIRDRRGSNNRFAVVLMLFLLSFNVWCPELVQLAPWLRALVALTVDLE